MPPRRPIRPVLPSAVFAVALAIGTVVGAVASDASPMPSPAVAPAITPADVGSVLSETSSSTVTAVPGSLAMPAPPAAARAQGEQPKQVERPKPAERPGKVKPKKVERPRQTERPKRAKPTYRGRNHVWIPALGIDRSVAGYSCSNQSYPGNRVYRWGCAGDNNVYLFGHAHSVFRTLHDAYERGRLRKGMALWYANGSGVVHRYEIAWWKVTTPTKGTWAYRSLLRPSLTLQTCLGAKSQYRLIVRLVRA